MKMGVMKLVHVMNDDTQAAEHVMPESAVTLDGQRGCIASRAAEGADGVSTIPAYLSSMMLLAHGLFNEPASAVHS